MVLFFFFKQKTAYEMRISDWSSDVCSSDLHTRIEEEIFYPAPRGKIEEDDLDEAYVEHDSAKALILELEQAQPDEEYYDAKVLVLKEQIEHHVKEEEIGRASCRERVCQ